MSTQLSCFRTSYIQDIPILTLIVESINARNAYWIKEDIRDYLIHHQHPLVLINLHNVLHIGHMGLGSLIAINNQLHKHGGHSAFIGLNQEVKNMLRHSHLEHAFNVWDLDSAVTPKDTRLQALDPGIVKQHLTDYLAKDYPIREDQIPRPGQEVHHKDEAGTAYHSMQTPAFQQELLATQQKSQRNRIELYLGAGLVGLIMLAICGWLGWQAALNYDNQRINPPLTREQLIERYDKNRDGTVDKEDVAMMTATEGLTLSYSPYCQELGIVCGPGALK